MTNQATITRFLLISSHLAGLIGIGFALHPAFIQLTPFSLLLSFSLLVWNHQPRHRGFFGFLAIAFLLGYWVEVAGVATGKIFGRYAYGEVLGWKLLDVPLMIGINWAMLSYIGCEVVNRLLPTRFPALGRIALAALAPTLVDVLIEPSAIRYGMWHWYGQMPPLQNYLGWYFVSLILAAAYHVGIGPAQRNLAAPWLLAMQVLFFAGLLGMHVL